MTKEIKVERDYKIGPIGSLWISNNDNSIAYLASVEKIKDCYLETWIVRENDIEESKRG